MKPTLNIHVAAALAPVRGPRSSAYKLTPWYPPHIKPVRAGVYETKYSMLGYVQGGYSHWDGKRWSNQRSGPRYLVAPVFPHAVQEKIWRGLTRNLSGAKVRDE